MSRLVVDSIRTLDLYRLAGTVMIYRGVRGEVCLDGLMGDGKLFCFPYTVDTEHMITLAPNDSDCWRMGKYDIPEPIPERSHLISPPSIDLVICPCVAFDGSLHRLGMGGGYYDRFLPECVNARFAAAAFEFQRVDSLPAEPWDVVMDCAVTEKRVHRSVR